jgi:hypothetical protein
MAKRNQQTSTPTQQQTANWATNDGACRCDGFNNVWDKRTTHWSSQCEDERERNGR